MGVSDGVIIIYQRKILLPKEEVNLAGLPSNLSFGLKVGTNHPPIEQVALTQQ